MEQFKTPLKQFLGYTKQGGRKIYSKAIQQILKVTPEELINNESLALYEDAKGLYCYQGELIDHILGTTKKVDKIQDLVNQSEKSHYQVVFA